MEIRITGANPPDAMFAHEDRGTRIVEDVASEVRKFGKDLCGHLSVARSGNKYAQPGRFEEAGNKFP